MLSATAEADAPAPAAPLASRRFRPDIEGLRAVAVALVVLFHAGTPLVLGGYVGVDVFFVVSGFLITGLLVAELHEHRSIALGGFYARRVRRLLPASAVVLIGTVVLMKVMAPPLSMLDLRGDAVATALYGSNIRFAVRATDYFATTAPSPMQHWWSLAVEEQFYVLWPMLLLLASRIRLPLRLVIGGVVVASFAASVALTRTDQPLAFFLLPTRAWELGLGGLLALGAVRVPDRLRRPLGWAGLAGIAVAAATFDTHTMFPGWAALLPVVSTATVIAAGGPAVLARRPMQWLGKRAYTLYLWHWPVLVIPALGLQEQQSPQKRALLVVVAVALAAITTRVVESPLRAAPVLVRSRRLTFALGVALTAIAVVVALAGSVMPPLDAGRPAAAGASATDYVPSDLRPTLRDARSDLTAIQRDDCDAPIPSTRAKGCVFGDPHSDTTVVLFGDSHAAQWFPAMEPAARAARWRLVTLTKSACPPLDIPVMYAPLNRRYTECEAWRRNAIERIAQERDPLVVITLSRAHHTLDDEKIMTVFTEGLVGIVRQLPPGTRVVLLQDTPRARNDVPTCLSTHLHAVRRCAPERSFALDADHRAAERAAAAAAGAAIVDPADWICTDDPCPPIEGNLLVWRDDHHLATPFAASLAPRLRAALAALL